MKPGRERHVNDNRKSPRPGCSCRCLACSLEIHCWLSKCRVLGSLRFHTKPETRSEREDRIVTEAAAKREAYMDVLAMMWECPLTSATQSMRERISEKAKSLATLISHPRHKGYRRRRAKLLESRRGGFR